MYPSDLTEKQWMRLEPLLNEPRAGRHAGGRPRKHEQRRVADAMLYVVKTGCQWRQLPSNFPPWKTVHEHFRAWRDSGVWERIGKTLREQGPSGKGSKGHAYGGDHRFAVCEDGTKRGRRGYDAG